MSFCEPRSWCPCCLPKTAWPRLQKDFEEKILKMIPLVYKIISYSDHGKSTLSDRIIEETSGLTKREMKEQVLDL